LRWALRLWLYPSLLQKVIFWRHALKPRSCCLLRHHTLELVVLFGVVLKRFFQRIKLFLLFFVRLPDVWRVVFAGSFECSAGLDKLVSARLVVRDKLLGISRVGLAFFFGGFRSIRFSAGLGNLVGSARF